MTTNILAMDYLIMVDYRSVDLKQQEIQRKRIDYILQRFQKRGEDVEKLKHVVIHYKGDDVNSLLEELRINITDPESSIDAFSCTSLDNVNDNLVTSFRYRFQRDYKSTEDQLDFWLTQLELKKEGTRRGMPIYKKKKRDSQVEVILSIMNAGEYTEIEMAVNGYGPLKSEFCSNIEKLLKFTGEKM